MTGSAPRLPLTSAEVLVGSQCELENAKMLDFWQWAFSDLRMNDVRGVFGEWLVAKLLNIQLFVRDSWGACDLETQDGVKIEVKTSAYLQAWRQKGTSSIVFRGLKGQQWDSIERYAGVATYNADIYVFCVQIEKDEEKWNALNLDQWRFYVVPKEYLETRNCKTISLSTLSNIASEMTAGEFRERALEMIQVITDFRRNLELGGKVQ